MELRELGPEDAGPADDLSRFTFGAAPRGEAPAPWPGIGQAFGVFDGARLLAAAYSRPYEQWWGGRSVTVAGVAGVAVHPDARGHGLARRAVSACLQGSGAALGVLYPTAPALYRGLGFEVVGSLDDTPVPLSSLPRDAPAGVTVGQGSSEEVAASYARTAPGTDGLLRRSGPSFVPGQESSRRRDLLQVARDGSGAVVGHLVLDRGRGYDLTSQLRVWELMASTADGYRALLASLASWGTVAGTALWRGAVDELALHVDARLPAPSSVQVWMLAVLDLPAAVEQRGFRGQGSARFASGGKGWLLEVGQGRGTVSPLPAVGLPVLSARGLALAFAGAPQTRLLRAGLLSAPVVGLDALLAGATPTLLDYF